MFDSRKYRPVDESLVEEFLRTQRHGTLMACAPGEEERVSRLGATIAQKLETIGNPGAQATR